MSSSKTTTKPKLQLLYSNINNDKYVDECNEYKKHNTIACGTRHQGVLIMNDMKKIKKKSTNHNKPISTTTTNNIWSSSSSYTIYRPTVDINPSYFRKQKLQQQKDRYSFTNHANDNNNTNKSRKYDSNDRSNARNMTTTNADDEYISWSAPNKKRKILFAILCLFLFLPSSIYMKLSVKMIASARIRGFYYYYFCFFVFGICR